MIFWHRLALAIGCLLVTLSTPCLVLAEGNVFYGGYGYDHIGCGIGFMPCGTYRYTRRVACNLSEDEQDTYHVFHVYDGYISSCDMVGGTGREQPATIERAWSGLLESVLIPTLVIMVVSSGMFWFYQRR